MTYAYVVTIETERDWRTLQWMSARGYDGNILALCDMIDSLPKKGYCQLGLDELAARGFLEYVESDPDAFLAGCASETLIQVLGHLREEIV